MTKFTGTGRGNYANALDGLMIGFKPKSIAKLQDNQGDTFNAKGGDDRIFGGHGDDILNGGGGNDVLIGDIGNDIINPGPSKLNKFGYGFEILAGIEHNDTFNVSAVNSYRYIVSYAFSEYEDDRGINANLELGLVIDTFLNIDTLHNVTFIAATNHDDSLVGAATNDLFAPGRADTFDTVNGAGGINTLLFCAFNFNISDPDDREDGFDYTAPIVVTHTGDNQGMVTSTDGVNVNFTNMHSIVGTIFGDTFNGSNFDDWLSGSGGDDLIDGNDGIDTVDYSGDVISGGRAGVTVNLTDGTATDGFGDTDTLLEIENVIGTRFADTIVGDANANLLTGGLGRDTLTGGLGVDTFDYDSKTDSKVGATKRDVITDFSGFTYDGDKIDLTDIDAKKGPNNQDFKWIGSAKFHHKAGELHVLNKGAGVFWVEGDIDGNGKADFQIEVHSIYGVQKEDILGLN